MVIFAGCKFWISESCVLTGLEKALIVADLSGLLII